MQRLADCQILREYTYKICEYYVLLLFSEVESDASIIVAPLSISALTFLVSIATFIAGVVMLVRAKRVLHTPPSPLLLGLTFMTWWMKEGREQLLVQGSTRR